MSDPSPRFEVGDKVRRMAGTYQFPDQWGRYLTVTAIHPDSDGDTWLSFEGQGVIPATGWDADNYEFVEPAQPLDPSPSPQPDDRLVEAVAAALYDHPTGGISGQARRWAELYSDPARETWREAARTAIAALKPSDSPSLQPGEEWVPEEGQRVRHETLGLGTVHTISEYHREDGTALVDFDAFNAAMRTVAFNKLSPVPEKPKTFKDEVYDFLRVNRVVDNDRNPEGLREAMSSDIETILERHIDSKRDEIMTVVSEVGDLPAETYARLRSLLLGSEQ